MADKPKRTDPESGSSQGAYSYYLDGDPLAGDSMSAGPPVDIFETDQNYILSAELPGVRHEDIQVEVAGSEITIRGTSRVSAACSDEQYHRLEGMRGDFRRTFSLPEVLDSGNIQSSLKDGILQLVVPKGAKSRRGSRTSARPRH